MVIVCIISFDWFLYFTGCIKKELCLPCIQDEHNSYPRYHLIYCLLSDSPFPCFTHNCGAPTTVRSISQNNHLAFSGHLCKCLLHGFSLQLLECYSRLFILPDSHHRRLSGSDKKRYFSPSSPFQCVNYIAGEMACQRTFLKNTTPFIKKYLPHKNNYASIALNRWRRVSTWCDKHPRELPPVEGSMFSMMEWTPEGKLNDVVRFLYMHSVCKPEMILR